MKRILCILLLLACVANAETWIYGRSRLSTGYRQEKNNGKIPFSLYPPALWYEFNYNDGSIVYDESGNNNTGTVSGATWVSDETGGHYSFDGNDSIDCGNNASIRITNSMTLAAWVKTTNQTKYQAIISKHGYSGSRGYELNLDMRAASKFVIFFVAVNDNTVALRRSAITNLYDGVWHHIAGVYSSVATTMNVYVDGRLCNGDLVGTIPSSQYIPSVNTMIGIRPSLDANSAAIGQIDMPLIDDSAWTSNQVYNLYLLGR